MKFFDLQLRPSFQIYLIFILFNVNDITAFTETNHSNYILTRKGMSSLSNHHLKVAGVEVLSFYYKNFND